MCHYAESLGSMQDYAGCSAVDANVIDLLAARHCHYTAISRHLNSAPS